MTTKFNLATDEGDSLPEIDPNSELGQIIYLLEYARLRDFQIGPNIQVGGTIINVRDLRQLKTMSRGAGEREVDIFEEHGASSER